MKFIGKHSLFTGLFCLVFSPLFSGEKSVKFGMGYKSFQYNAHKTLLHSGRYFHGGYSYQFGDQFKNKFQFQVSNSNREVELDLPYVSAATAFNAFYDIGIKTISTKKYNLHLGVYAGNDFNLDFFPKLDNKNFLWANQSFTGLSVMTQFQLKKKGKIDLSAHVPVYSNIVYNRMDRFSSEVPGNRPTQQYAGFANKLFNSNLEIGYLNKLYWINFGVYYQAETNSVGKTKNQKIQSTAHSLSLRINY